MISNPAKVISKGKKRRDVAHLEDSNPNLSSGNGNLTSFKSLDLPLSYTSISSREILPKRWFLEERTVSGAVVKGKISRLLRYVPQREGVVSNHRTVPEEELFVGVSAVFNVLLSQSQLINACLQHAPLESESVLGLDIRESLLDISTQCC